MGRPSTAADLVAAATRAKEDVAGLVRDGHVPRTARRLEDLREAGVDPSRLGGLDEPGVDWSEDHVGMVLNTVEFWLRKGHARRVL